MLSSVMGPIGGSVGYAVHILFVSDDDKGETFKSGIFKMCCACAIVIYFLYFIIIFVLKEKPPVPPTKSASYIPSEPVCKSLKDLITNKNFMFVTQVFSLVYACLTTFGQEVSLIISPYGFKAVSIF